MYPGRSIGYYYAQLCVQSPLTDYDARRPDYFGGRTPPIRLIPNPTLKMSGMFNRLSSVRYRIANSTRETLINGPTSEVAGEMASNFLDDEANRRSIQ